jgi:hypothetical protein
MSTDSALSATLQGDQWNQLQALERRRNQAIAEHERAIRDLYAASESDPDGLGRQVFKRYCEAAEDLEHTLVELQLFRWSRGK